jgi:drug/metabolite transporter (DMT)-like permease
MGETAALLTSVCWAFSAIIFTFAGRRVGAGALNRIRLIFALILIMSTHWVSRGFPLPLDATPAQWGWLGLSGVLGLTLGDLALFQTYIYIGPRIGTLMMAGVPVLSAALAWLVLGEVLKPTELLGIGLAVAGIAVVVLERQDSRQGNGPKHDKYLLGIFFGFLAAAGQTTGLILTKRGLEGGYPALSGVLIRMIVATAAAWIVAFASRQVISTFQQLRDRKVFALIAAGSLVGPFVGIWLSTIAVQYSAVGIASTLMALNPVFLLPVSKRLFGEPVSWRAGLGTMVTITGVAVLFLL